MRVSLPYGPYTGHPARNPAEDEDGGHFHDAEPLQATYTFKMAHDTADVRTGFCRGRVLQLLSGDCDFTGSCRDEGQHLSERFYDGHCSGRQFLQAAFLVQYLSAWIPDRTCTQDFTFPGEKGYGILHGVRRLL